MDADRSAARAVADTAAGLILASVEVTAPLERAFRALATSEIVAWWVRPGIFDTREWQAELRAGGLWLASGVGAAGPYSLEGRFVEVDPPRRLVHTWHPAGTDAPTTTVTYTLEAIGARTRITLRHEGFTAADACVNTALGWETSFARLAELLARESAQPPA